MGCRPPLSHDGDSAWAWKREPACATMAVGFRCASLRSREVSSRSRFCFCDAIHPALSFRVNVLRMFRRSRSAAAFMSALLENPHELVVCKLITIDTDPSDLPPRRRGKPHVLGWDGKKFLGHRIDEERAFAREAAKAERAAATAQASIDPRARKLAFDISEMLVPSLNAITIAAAPTVRELHGIVGSPSRLLEPKQTAPVGHRSTRLHVYDDLGLVFWEHHYTRRISSCQLVFWPDEVRLLGDQPPPCQYTGLIRIGGFVLPYDAADLDSVMKGMPLFREVPRGSFWPTVERNGFSLRLTSTGYRLKNGGRTKCRRLVSMDLTWPHDPWGEPVTDDLKAS